MISAVIFTKNEEKNIRRCIENLGWCDEIVVVDDFSTDGTLQIAQNLNLKSKNQNSKLKTFQRKLNGDFAAQRNFGLSKASGDWVLFVDADEVVSEALASEISNFPPKGSNAFPISNEVNGYFIKRRDIMFGKELKHGEIGGAKFLRLARKGSGLWKRKVHEFWDVRGDAGELKNPIMHYPHQTLSEFVSDVDFYSTLHAKQKFEDGERSNVFKILFWPKVKFIRNYWWRLGFLDGTEGFVHAMMMSFHSFLAWSKLLLMRNKATGNK